MPFVLHFILFLLHIHIHYTSATVDTTKVTTWAKAMSDKFDSDMKNVMGAPSLQKLYDEASETVSNKNGAVEAAGAASELKSILSTKDKDISTLVTVLTNSKDAKLLTTNVPLDTSLLRTYFARIDGTIDLITNDEQEIIDVASKVDTDIYNPTITPWFSASVAGPKDIFIIADLAALNSLSAQHKTDYIGSLTSILDTISPNDMIWFYKMNMNGKIAAMDDVCAIGATRGTADVIRSLKTKIQSYLSTTNGGEEGSSDIDVDVDAAARWINIFRETFKTVNVVRGTDIETRVGSILLLTTSKFGPRRAGLVFSVSSFDGKSHMTLKSPLVSNTKKKEDEIRNHHQLPIFTFHIGPTNNTKIKYECDSFGTLSIVPSEDVRSVGRYYLHLVDVPTLSTLDQVKSTIQFFGGLFNSPRLTPRDVDYGGSNSINIMTILRPVYIYHKLIGVVANDYHLEDLKGSLDSLSGRMGQTSFPMLTTPQGDTIYHMLSGRYKKRGLYDVGRDLSRYEHFPGFMDQIRIPFLKGEVGEQRLSVNRAVPAGDSSTEGFYSQTIDTYYYYAPVGHWDLRILLAFDSSDMQKYRLRPAEYTKSRVITSQVEDYISTQKGKDLLSKLTGTPKMYNNNNCNAFQNCQPDAYCDRVIAGTPHPIGTVAGAPACVVGSTCICEEHRWAVNLLSRECTSIHFAPTGLTNSLNAFDAATKFSNNKNAKQNLTYDMTRFLNDDKFSTNPDSYKASDEALDQLPFLAVTSERWLNDANNIGIHTDTVWIYYATYTGIMTMYPASNWGFLYDATRRPWWSRAITSGSEDITAVISTPFQDAGGAGLINTMAVPIFTKTRKIQGVMGLDFLFPVMNSILPQVSDCSTKSVRDIGKTAQGEVACFLIEFSGLLITHSDFLITTSEKIAIDDFDGNEWPVENVFLGKKEPDLANVLIREKVFVKTVSQSPDSETMVYYFKTDLTVFTEANPVLYGVIDQTNIGNSSCLDLTGAVDNKIKWFITHVKKSNTLLLVVEGYKRKATECTIEVKAKAPSIKEERLNASCTQDSNFFISKSKSWQKVSNHFCKKCAPGMFSNMTNSICQECIKGKYSEIYGNNQCDLCPSGKYSEMEALSSCSECQIGLYSLEIGAAVFPCKPYERCPKGADCRLSDGLRETNLIALNGHWRLNSTSRNFIDCSQAYLGTGKKKFAKERCCPVSIKNYTRTPVYGKDITITTICNRTLDDNGVVSVNSQCAKGYQGKLCATCSVNYVKNNNICRFCRGGAQFASAILGLLIFAFLFFSVSICAMRPCSIKHLFHNGHGAGSTLTGQFKIMLTFMQLVSGMTTTFDSIPWPKAFTDVSDFLSIGNINLGTLMGGFGNCAMSLAPLDRFVIIMLTPIFLSTAILIAYHLMKIVLPQNPTPVLLRGHMGGTIPRYSTKTVPLLKKLKKLPPLPPPRPANFKPKYKSNNNNPNHHNIPDNTNTGFTDFSPAPLPTVLPIEPSNPHPSPIYHKKSIDGLQRHIQKKFTDPHEIHRSAFIIEGWELWAVCMKLLIITVLLLYPSQSAGVFSVVRCKYIDGIDGSWLQMDLRIQCWSASHVPYVVVAIAGGLFYVIGTPFYLFLQLYLVKHRLHNKDQDQDSKTLSLNFEYGGLYHQYKPTYWYFEIMIVLNKMLFTGLLTIVFPGTPAQMILAFFIMVCFFLLVLKLAPYNSILDDYVSSFTTAGTCIVTFVGLLLLMDENREVKLFNSGALGGFLAAITILIMCVNLFGISYVITGYCKKIKAKEKNLKKHRLMLHQKLKLISMMNKNHDN